MPEFGKAGSIVGFDRMPLIKIDCDEKDAHQTPVNTKLCGLFDIQGFPAIVHVSTHGFQASRRPSSPSSLLSLRARMVLQLRLPRSQ